MQADSSDFYRTTCPEWDLQDYANGCKIVRVAMIGIDIDLDSIR